MKLTKSIISTHFATLFNDPPPSCPASKAETSDIKIFSFRTTAISFSGYKSGPIYQMGVQIEIINSAGQNVFRPKWLSGQNPAFFIALFLDLFRPNTWT